MQSPRTLNPRLSPATDQALVAALAMHPDQRPASIDEFRAMLPDVPSVVSAPGNNHRPAPVIENNWAKALQQNRVLIAVLVSLLVLAVLVTLFAAPTAPPMLPTITPAVFLR